ncbi:MAG: hypothetical protein LKJ47_03135 [Bifidobacteriaceae bacterium]|jgi:hypothetical protein|nr:hypothetical protein [Bifidobacteriaceae bacterium]
MTMPTEMSASISDKGGAEEVAVSPELATEFPELAHFNDLDDDQRADAFTTVLSRLHRTLDDVTER